MTLKFGASRRRLKYPILAQESLETKIGHSLEGLALELLSSCPPLKDGLFRIDLVR